MIYIGIQIALMLCMEMLRVWTYTRILTIKAAPPFYAAFLSGFAILTTMRLLDAPLLARGLLSILIDFALPIAFSKDKLIVRLQRFLLVQFVVFLTEIIASTTYSLITNGSITPDAIGPHNVAPIVTVYIQTILLTAALFQLVTAICHKIDGIDAIPLQGPVAALALGTTAVFLLMYLRFSTDGFSAISYSLASSAFFLVSIVIEGLIFASATKESNAHKELAFHARTARQAKHERAEIEAIAKKAAALYALRHALANQMRDIANLASSGQVQEADARLFELQEQARACTGSHHD